MAESIGLMRERLRILQRTETTDTHGGRSVVWTALDSVPAELLPIRASERLQAQAMQAQLDLRFRVRARSDITSEMRAEWRPSAQALSTPRTLEIHGVLPHGDGRTWLLLECGEVAA